MSVPLYEFVPTDNITIQELIKILQNYVPGDGTALPRRAIRIPDSDFPIGTRHHFRRVE